jgi:hypothetical protein
MSRSLLTRDKRTALDRWHAYGHAITRTAIGLQIMLVPDRSIGRRWFGSSTENAATRIAMRGMGAREMVLGLAIMRELSQKRSTRPLFVLCAFAETVDILGSLFGPSSFRRTPAVRVTMLAIAAVASGAYLTWRDDA